jgi:hypothetical protein
MTGPGERSAAVTVGTIDRWAAGLNALYGQIAHCFGRAKVRERAWRHLEACSGRSRVGKAGWTAVRGSRREIVRYPKRYLVREVHRTLRADLAAVPAT